MLASEAFARANGLRVGDTIGAILNGRWATLTIVGLALSPEYIYEIGPGMIFPDNRRFGVLWMEPRGARSSRAPGRPGRCRWWRSSTNTWGLAPTWTLRRSPGCCARMARSPAFT